MELTCVKCGKQEPMVLGVTVVSADGKLEQACLDDFNEKERPSQNEGRPNAQGGHKRSTNLPH